MSSTALARTSNAPTSRQQTPSTPASQQKAAPAASPAPATPQQPGTWSHPRLDEIARRQNASVFNGDNINRVAVNVVMLLSSFAAPAFLHSYTPELVLAQLRSISPYSSYGLLIGRLVLLINIIMACMPLVRQKDDITDIPLTPSQRALLGLKPSSTPLTPGQQYSTPPRYARSATPRSNQSAKIAASGSPMSQRGASPSSLDRSTFGRDASVSPYSPSPLVQKALGAGSSAKRLSFNQNFPFDMSTDGSASTGLPPMAANTINAGKASVGLNSKWLYERGRGSPNGRGVFT